jgi:hypothetical protein
MLFDKIQLEEGEKIVKTARKHWFIIGVQMGTIVVFGLFPIFILIGLLALPAVEILANFLQNQSALIVFALASWLLLSTMAAATVWTSYYLDLWIITDRRIIVIEQDGFFRRRVGNFRLERLQDIQVTINGVIPTLLDFGTIRAQTASASESNFESPGLPRPRELQSIIQTAMDARLNTLGHDATPIIQ